MMFGKNKYTQQIIRLEEKISALEQDVANGNAQHADIGRSLDQLCRSVREQGMSVEDLLEEWNEKKSSEDSGREKLRQCAQDERNLLELFEAYQEQFWSMKRFADANDEAWAVQMGMMEKELERCRQRCGISVIGRCGETVDYDLHEVIEAVGADSPELDKKIADVYRCGYLYKGRVQRKAQVAAYSVNVPVGDSDGCNA